jgi:preprotein translocase subunit SecF
MERFTGFEIFRKRTSIDFLGFRKVAAVLSVIMLVGSVVLLIPAVRGLNLSIDFTGGVVLELGYPAAADLDGIRERLAGNGFADAQVQSFGTSRDVLVRVLPREGRENQQVAADILDVLRGAEPGVVLRRTEFVGPQVGDELTEQGALALLFALGGIALYIMFRFQWKFSVGAMVATIHDPLSPPGSLRCSRCPSTWRCWPRCSPSSAIPSTTPSSSSTASARTSAGCAGARRSRS